MAELGPGDFDLAFNFSRSAEVPYLDASGVTQVAAVDQPVFDHDATGRPLGLRVARGFELGQEDRPRLDPLILPADVAEGEDPADREVTVFHHWLPEGATAERRDAWYSRDAVAAIDALGRQAGHHLAFGVVRGFMPNRNGETRLRAQSWRLSGYLLASASTGRVLTDGAQPLITGGPGSTS